MSTEPAPNRTIRVGKLTARQQRAVMVLATGATNEQAASLAGVGNGTITKWMHEEDFRQELSRAMERMRQIFESRMIGLASNAARIVQELMDNQDIDRRTEGAKLALNAAVRLVGRYKELQVDGFIPPNVPLVIFPENARMPWTAPALTSGEAPIDVEGDVVESTEPEIDTH
jgi:hypothetical protein